MKSPQKRIGVLCFKAQENGNVSVASAYASFAAMFGTIVPIFALDEYVNTDIDMLILIGGQDVDSSRYGAKPAYMAGNPNIQLEWFDKFMLPQYIDANIPILGICRGFQTLNVVYGGVLNQHINQQYSKTRDETVHDITLTAYAADMFNFFKCDPNNDIVKHKKGTLQKVNSLHHQGFNIDQCGEGIVPIATNSSYNNVEAIWVRNKPIFAVQWHPEEINDRLTMFIVRHLLRYGFNNM